MSEFYAQPVGFSYKESMIQIEWETHINPPVSLFRITPVKKQPEAHSEKNEQINYRIFM